MKIERRAEKKDVRNPGRIRRDDKLRYDELYTEMKSAVRSKKFTDKSDKNT